MGVIQSAREWAGYISPPVLTLADIRAIEKAERVAALRGEAGVSGTANFWGQIHSEENADLQFEAGYGSPGSTTWGEWERMRRTDSAVASAVSLLAAPLRDCTVELTAAGKGDVERAIADYVRDNLLEWMEPGWAAVVEQMVEGLVPGFSIHEVCWGARDDERVPGGKALYVYKLAERLPSSLRVTSNCWVEENGELVSVLQAGTRDGKWVDDIRLPASKILLASWNRRGNNYQGDSAFRSVWYVAKLRRKLLNLLAIGSEREALGVPVAMPDKDAPIDAAKLGELQKFMEHMTGHEHAAMVMPHGVSMEWVYSPVANKGHVLQCWRELGLAILEVVQQQQTYLGTSQTGSRAVGEVHDATRNSFVAGVRAHIEAVLNGVGKRPYTGLVAKIVDANFGPQKRYPKLKLTVKRSELAALDFANAVKTLRDGGVITVTAADENAARERVGLPPIDEAERSALVEEEKQRKAEEAERQLAGFGQGQKEEEEEEDQLKEAPAKAFSEASAFVPRRPLRPEEHHLALGEMDAFHTSARLEFESHIRDILGDMVRGAAPVIRDAMADGDPSELGALALDTKLLAKAVEVFIERARAFGYRMAGQERKRQPAGLLAKREAGKAGVPAANLLADRLAHVFAFEEDDKDTEKTEPRATPPEPAVAKLVKAQTQLVTNRIRQRLKQQIQDEAIDAVRRGESAGDVVESLEEDLEESKTLRTDAGFVVARSFSMGREQFWAEHGEDISHMVYSAVLDGRQCGACSLVDGREIEYGSAEHDALTPPYSDCDGGQNCRCLLVVVWKGGQGFQRIKD